MKDLSIYVHIPFCEHKCIYCDFYSVTDFSAAKSFTENLKKEIESYSKNFSENNCVKTIFFGGGTPSILEPEKISEIIDSVKRNFTLDKNAEITLESNPGTLSSQKFEGYLKAGVNRLSVGVQSFFDDDLKMLSRIHNSTTAVDTIKIAADTGFENINLDMIFGLPKQSMEKWKRNLEQVVELPVKHISSYSLIVEEETPLYKMVERGKVKILSDEFDAKFYLETVEFYKNYEFEQYEVSNFSKKGFECEHNLAYWEYKNYLGFGPSAHSFYEGKRWYNINDVKKYNEYIFANGEAISGREEVDKEQKLFEMVMLGLRARGIDLNSFKKNFGSDWLERNKNNFSLFEEKGFMKTDSSRLQLTPLGYSMCDEILTKLL